jgi:putative tricarboxylic transport membrane protein
MYIGNLFLLILSVPLVGLFVQLLRVRFSVLAPITIMVTMLGTYSINNSVIDMTVALAFGVLGYLMLKSGYEPGPLVLAFILGALLETSFRQSLTMSNGDLGIFVSRPFSAILLAVTALIVALAIVQFFRKGAGD